MSSDQSPQTIFREVEVLNEYGIHARPAALFVKTAGKFTCEIMVEKDGIKVSGKSIMGLLTLEGHYQSKLILSFAGDDAEEAAIAMQELFDQKFFED